MATLAQLQDEPWWGREIVTSPMVGLGLQLRAAYNVGASAFGIKGNTAHLSGGHRSQEWLKNSVYCTNRTYTVQSGLTTTQARMCSAFDFTPGSWGTPDNRAKMKVLTKRLIDAMKAGKLNELDEVFGTLDGVHVTGYNNDANSTVTADSSHLDHIHGRFDRRYADDNAVVAKVAAIMLGEEPDMGVPEDTARAVWGSDLADGAPVEVAYKALLRGADNAQAAKEGVAELAARPPVVAAPVDPAALKAVLLDPEVLAALAKAVNDDAAARLES